MRRSFLCGTATTLLVTMASLQVGVQEALAVKGGYTPSEALDGAVQEAYGSESVVTTETESMNEMLEKSASMSAIAISIASGVAMTAAGIELVR